MKKLIALVAGLIVAVSVHAANYPDIDIKSLKEAIAAKKVALLDANGESSFKSGRIPGAIHFTGDKTQLASKLPEDKNTLIVAYCGGPKCKAYQAAAKAAQELGYTNVKHFSAGISGWKSAGEKTDSGS